jgi:TraM recognition site of TraD and TraG
MKNDDRVPQDGVMGAPGDNYDVYLYAAPVSVVRRRPLEFAPRSTTRHNYGLLPNLEEMAGTSLAFRHTVSSFAELAGSARYHVIGLLLFGALVPVPFMLLGRELQVRPDYGLIGSFWISVVWTVILLFTRRVTIRGLLTAALVPVGLFVLAVGMAYAGQSRILFSTGAALLCAGLLRWLWKRPFNFCIHWLYTHPRLRPATREKAPVITAADAPDWRLLAAILTIVVVLPVVSTWMTLVVLLAIPAAAMKFSWRRFREATACAMQTLTPYVTYGSPHMVAPGVWWPTQSRQRRRRVLRGIFVPFMLTLATGLTMFFPLGDHFLRDPRFAYNPDRGDMHGWATLVMWERPDQWLEYWWTEGMYGRRPAVIASGLLAVCMAAVLPAPLLIAVFRRPLRFAGNQRALVEGGKDSEGRSIKALDDDGRPEWQWYVDRMKHSTHTAKGPLGGSVREAEHHFLGVEPHASFPVLLHQKLLAEHCYMVGDSGSGKTSQGLMPLLIQLIDGHHDDKGQRTPCPPVVILDLKGDPALLNLARKLATDRGAPFRVFTPELNKATHYFNPFPSLDSKHRTDIQLCNILMDALSLNHGEGYGRGYYGRQSRGLLLAVMENMQGPSELESGTTGRKKARSSKRPSSMADLYERLKAVRAENEREFKDTLELLSTVQALTRYKALGMAASEDDLQQAIHMPTVLQDRQVVYFYLPAAIESISVREIAKLALYSLLTACIDRQRDTPNDPRQAYLIIDEFQRIAGENFRIILEQARSYGLSVTLANQSIADLNTAEVDLRPTVRTNTRVKRFFSLSDPHDVRSMSESSGEELMYLRTWTTDAGAPYTEMVATAHTTRADSQGIKPRLTQNDILAISDHPLDSILFVSRGSGYTQFAGLPIQVRCTWPLSEATYTTLKNAPWPSIEDLGGHGVAIENDVSPESIERARDADVAVATFHLIQSINAQRT